MGIATIALKLKSVFGFLATDSTGSIKANVVHRTGTIASLQQLVSPVGEIAVATDTPALVVVTSAGGQAVYPGGPGGIRPADFINGIPGYFGSGETILTFPLAGTGGTPGITGLIQLRNFLDACTYDQSANVIVDFQAGDYSQGGTVKFSNTVPLRNVTLRGFKWNSSEYPTTSATETTAVTGTQFDFYVTLAVPTSASFVVGDYAAVMPDPSATAANDIRLAGAWEVTAKPDATHITIHYLGDAAPTVAAFVSPYSIYSLSSKIAVADGAGGITIRRMLCHIFTPGGETVKVCGVGSMNYSNVLAEIEIVDLMTGQAGLGLCLSNGGSFGSPVRCTGTSGYLVCNDPQGNTLTLGNGITGTPYQVVTVAAALASSTFYLLAGQKVSCLFYQQCNSDVGAILGAGASLCASAIVSVGVTTPYQAEAGTALTLNTMGPQLQFVAVG